MATIRRKSKLANGSAAGKPNLTMAYGAVASDLMARLGDAQAAQMGPPTSNEDKVAPATAEDRVKAWNTRNPEATDEAMQALANQKYQEHIAAGMDPAKAERATAEDLTHFRYNQRLKIYTYGTVGFAEQVEAAKRMAKIAARESTPNPLPPAPTMPSAAMTNAALGSQVLGAGFSGKGLPGAGAAVTPAGAPVSMPESALNSPGSALPSALNSPGSALNSPGTALNTPAAPPLPVAGLPEIPPGGLL